MFHFNAYCKIKLFHIFFGFPAPDTISRQAVLCHRVLRTLQEVAQTSTIMTRDTWESLLLFLIAINDTLLAPPSFKGIVSML